MFRIINPTPDFSTFQEGSQSIKIDINGVRIAKPCLEYMGLNL